MEKSPEFKSNEEIQSYFKETEAKRKELSASMHALPDELGEELRQRFITERNKSHTQNNASQSKGKTKQY